MRSSSREIDHRGDVALGQLGHRHELARLRVVQADDRPAVFVDGRDAIAPAVREPREDDVPVGRLDVLVLAGRELIALDARELAPVVRQVIEPLRVGIELGRPDTCAAAEWGVMCVIARPWLSQR